VNCFSQIAFRIKFLISLNSNLLYFSLLSFLSSRRQALSLSLFFSVSLLSHQRTHQAHLCCHPHARPSKIPCAAIHKREADNHFPSPQFRPKHWSRARLCRSPCRTSTTSPNLFSSLACVSLFLCLAVADPCRLSSFACETRTKRNAKRVLKNPNPIRTRIVKAIVEDLNQSWFN